MKLSVREAETIIIKILTPAYCPITKASSNSHFHSSHCFAPYFPSQYQWFFLSLLPFLILEIKNNCVQSHITTRTVPQGQHHVSSAQKSWALFCGIRNWMGDQKRIPCVVMTSFFHSLSKAIVKTAELPSLVWCRSFYNLFVSHFALSSFACIFTISYNRPNKQPDPSFEFFSILLTFGRLKQ